MYLGLHMLQSVRIRKLFFDFSTFFLFIFSLPPLFFPSFLNEKIMHKAEEEVISIFFFFFVCICFLTIPSIFYLILFKAEYITLATQALVGMCLRALLLCPNSP